MRVTGEQAIQGSNEWLEIRKGKRTASTTPIIMEKSPFKKKKTYAEELIGIKKPYFNKAMQQGNDFEIILKNLVKAINKKEAVLADTTAGVNTLRSVLSIYKAIRTGAPVKLL